MRIQETSGLSSSPHSSDEAASHHGTPDTKLTAFSPEDVRSGARGKLSIDVGPKSFKDFKAANVSNGPEQDPFLAAPPKPTSSGRPQLSPTASAFTPKGATASSTQGIPFSDAFGATAGSNQGMPPRGAFGGTTAGSNQGIPSGGAFGASARPAQGNPFRDAFRGNEVRFFVPGVGPTPRTPLNEPTVGFAGLPVYGIPYAPAYDDSMTAHIFGPVNFGEFTIVETASRAFSIEDIPTTTSSQEVAALFAANHFVSLKGPVFTELATKGVVYVGFSDARDARQAFDKIELLHPEWRLRHIKPRELIKKLDPDSVHSVSNLEGQVFLSAYYSKHNKVVGIQPLAGVLRDFLSTLGELKCFRVLHTGQSDVRDFLVEFFDTRAAANAVLSLDQSEIGDCLIVLKHHQPDVDHDNYGLSSPGRRDAHNAAEARALFGKSTDRSGQFPTAASVRRSHMQLSPTGRSTIPRNERAAANERAYGRRNGNMEPPRFPVGSNLPRFPKGLNLDTKYSSTIVAPDVEQVPLPLPFDLFQRSPRRSDFPFSRVPMFPPHFPSTTRNGVLGLDQASGPHNTVDISKIREGHDVRTTIMLRNIPNKVDQALLKDIIDETSFGRYDFMYLRIDFANNCNVGYAFVNFVRPEDIVEFAKARAGQRWNRFNSDKIAEISYATIQGKDCLVQKFRNSSVMLEHPSFRPKVFYTGSSPIAGTEDPFPGPDNPSKMRRSVENAEHVGLYRRGAPARSVAHTNAQPAGLYTPRAGQQFREDQRRRHPTFDRGTPAAEQDLDQSLTRPYDAGHLPTIFQHNGVFIPPMQGWYEAHLAQSNL